MQRPPAKIAEALQENIRKVIHGQDLVIRRLLAALAGGGHVLLEDYPGTGKTTLAKALALSIAESDFKRLQFTPDLLPSDILGVSILDPKDQQFRFHPGPVFTNVLLADEINRASPRTQSALLEAMGEGQTTIEGKRMDLSDFFFVIATQNPVEFRGTYPLPEAQMDRFAMQCTLGYVSPEVEMEILTSQNNGHPLDTLEPCASLVEIESIKTATNAIRISDELKRYVVDIVTATRKIPEVQLAASPRASLSLMKTAKALALLDGQEFVSPDHIQEIACDVIAHRLVLDPQAKFSGLTGRKIVSDIIETIPVPS